MKKGKIVLGVAITLCAVLCLTGCKTKLKNGFRLKRRRRKKA